VPRDRVKFVGNIMIDTLEANREKALELDSRKSEVYQYLWTG
jgi:UDP-N-acetylglucosamine 2-epimerase